MDARQPWLFDASPASDTLPIRAAAEPTTLRVLAVPVQIEAAKGEGKRPTFTIVGYTGAPVNVAGFFSPVILDLAGIKTPGQVIPALRSHDVDRIVGQTDAIKVGSTVELSGVITGENDDAREVVSQSNNGFRWQASVGAEILRREFLEAGKTATVNGREVVGPMVLVRESMLREISFVAIGADGNTSASVAASSLGSSQKGEPTMFEEWLKAKGIDPKAIDDPTKTALEAAYKAEQSAKAKALTGGGASGGDDKGEPPAAKAKAKDKPTLDDLIGEIQAEEERKDRITELCAASARERPMMRDEFLRIGRTAIEAKSPVAEVELALLRVRASAPGTFAIHGGDRKTSARVISAAIAISGRLDNLEKHYDQQTLNACYDRYPNGIGLQELILIHARENGYHGNSVPRDLENVLRAAFRRSDIQATGGGGFSTLSLPGILSNTANKFLVESFMAVESAWRQISSSRSVSDFKAITSYALTGDMTYEKVGPTGEIKHATLGEDSYSNQAETYARMLAISRRDIINDDLGAFTAVPRRLGRGGAIKLNEVFWTTFLAGVGSFWAAGNNNLITGGGTVLSSAGLKSALEKFRKQTDQDGKPVAITPKFLLVPPELEITADELMTSTAVNTGGSSTTDKVPNRNVWASKFTPVSSTYLSNSSYTGYSTTAWFLLADPRDLATIEVAFLNGKDMPTLESAEADFGTLGIQFRGYHDFGCALQEERASVRAAGA